MSDNDKFGDRMKLYEAAEAQRRFMPTLPIVARIDGRSFHSFTSGMQRPFDAAFNRCMIETTQHLVEESNALVGYMQSDEITLAWHSTDPNSEVYFAGRIQKMTSQLAAQATIAFYRSVLNHMPEYAFRMPTFDCRVWNVPSRTEAANVFLWREFDAVKNSVSMAAHHYLGHAKCMHKNTKDKMLMLEDVGIVWGNYPDSFKRGTYIRREKVLRTFTSEEIDRLPPKHAARANPSLQVERSDVAIFAMPVLSKVTNREAVLFSGAQPELQLEAA